MATREEIELIRERVDMIEVLGRYLKLKPSGSRYVALCPFHPDKHPSLVIDPEKKLFHCFGCGAGGDVFHFLMRIENLSFGEAVARLAREAGVELSRPTSTKHDRLLELNERVARYFQQNLASPAGAKARRYLMGRGLQPETIKRFRLGYALPGWNNLVKTFPDPEALLQLGLVLRGREGGFYDRFRDRVIFPLADHRGRVIGFAGRSLHTQQEEPKYLNIPNTPLFTKGQALYGLHLAREAQPEEFILVEGYLDVITAHQAGFTNAIATMGTALTEQQARLLRRYVERVVLVYDRDAAGQQAALRGMRALRNAGLDVYVALLPVGEDPDSLIRSRGAEAFRRVLQRALPFHKFYLELLAEAGIDRHDPLQVERALHEAASFVREISSRPLRYELIRGLAELFDLPEEEVELELKRATREAPSVPRREKRLDGRPWGAEEHVLHFLLRGDLPPERALRELDPADFQRYRGIIEEIFDQIRKTGLVRPEALLERLSAEEASIVTALALAEVEFRDRGKALDDALSQLKLRHCRRELEELQARLRAAEADGKVAEAQRLLEESRRKQAELLRLLRRGLRGPGQEQQEEEQEQGREG